MSDVETASSANSTASRRSETFSGSSAERSLSDVERVATESASDGDAALLTVASFQKDARIRTKNVQPKECLNLKRGGKTKRTGVKF